MSGGGRGSLYPALFLFFVFLPIEHSNRHISMLRVGVTLGMQCTGRGVQDGAVQPWALFFGPAHDMESSSQMEARKLARFHLTSHASLLEEALPLLQLRSLASFHENLRLHTLLTWRRTHLPSCLNPGKRRSVSQLLSLF